MRHRRFAHCILLACCVAGCGEPGTVRIGDGVPRVHGAPTLATLVQRVLDSVPGRRRIAIEPWGAPVGMEIVRALEGAEAFASTPGLIGVVGHAGSRDAMLAATVYNARGVPQLVPTGTSRRLSTVGPWTFPLVPNDSVEGAFLAAYAIDSLHAGRVGVLYVGDEYGIGLRDGVRSSLRARAMDVVDETMVPNRACSGSYFREIEQAPAAAAIRRARPDVVVLAVGERAARCIIETISHERPETWMLAADGVEITDTLSASLGADARRRLRAVSFWVPTGDSANVAFVTRWERLFKRRPSAADALSYDGMLLLAAAVRDGSATRADVRRWIESLGRSRPPFPGATGPISFDHGRVGVRLRMVAPREPPA